MHCRPFLERMDLLISRPEIMFCNFAWEPPLAERSRHNVCRSCSRTVEELVMPRYHHGRLLRWCASSVESQASLEKNLRTEALPFQYTDEQSPRTYLSRLSSTLNFYLTH